MEKMVLRTEMIYPKDRFGFTTTIFYDYFLLLLMFNKFWKMKEGFAFGAGLIVVGLALQFSVGPIHWSDFAYFRFFSPKRHLICGPSQ